MWIVLDTVQAERVQEFRWNGVGVDPRLVDLPSSPTFGKYVVPDKVLEDIEYAPWLALLSGLPTTDALPSTLFAPPPEETD